MGDTLRVAVLQDEWFPAHGGGVVSAYELCQNLVDHHDVQVHIYTRQLRYEGETYTDVSEPYPGIRVVRMPPCTKVGNPISKGLYLVSPLLYCRSGYDIVHAHTYIPGFPGRLYNLLYGTPIVYTVRGTSVDAEAGVESASAGPVGRLKKRIERFLVADLNYSTVISVNRDFIERFGHCHDDIRFLPNGVDVQKFAAPPPEDATDFLFVGRLAGKKGVDDLLEAFALVHDSHPEATLTIVGEGPLKADFERQAKRLGLGNVVSFEGHVPYEEIERVYAAADVFVLPSEWEGHPRVMLEAWASSRPLVGTAVEGIEEFVRADETGWLVPFDAPEILADRLRWCIDHPDAVRSCGETAREVVEAQYSWKAIADQTHDIYRELVAE